MVKSAWDKEEEGGEGCGLTADSREGTRLGHLSNENPKRRLERAKALWQERASFPCSRRSKKHKEVWRTMKLGLEGAKGPGAEQGRVWFSVSSAGILLKARE